MPTKVGDISLRFLGDGIEGKEVLGDSHGLFQVRTGGRDEGGEWNRAKANGLTAWQYAEKLKDYRFNIMEAKKVRSGGWDHWYICNQKVTAGL